MDIRKLQRAIVDGLEDVKAQHIAVFNTEHLSAMFERVIIASGTSNRQTKALASSVREAVKGRDMQVLSTEGEDNGEWIIVDCGAAVVHIMQPAIREYYHLEEIWGGKNVRLKIGEVNTKLVKASEPVSSKGISKDSSKGSDLDSVRPQPKRAPAKKRVSREVIEQKAGNRTAAFQRVAGKNPARKKPAFSRDSTAPASKTIVVKPAGKPAPKAAAKSAGKPAGKSAPAKRPAAKKVAAKAAPRTAAKAAPKATPRSAPKAAPRTAAKSAPKPAAKPARKTPRGA
jgi:ribosome-associated protein